MWTPPARLSLLAASLALAPACGLFGSDGVTLPVQLVTRACSGPAPLEGATHLRLRVTGEGMEPRELLVPVTALPQALDDVPAGPARVLEVRAYRDRPAAGGQVLALGRSAPFDVEGESPAPVRVTLRRVNAFTPASDAEHPEVCVSLAAARAGHSATLLADGRVLFAGGFALEGDARVALASAELYAPGSGTVSPAPALALGTTPAPRFFHTASLLPSGQVLVAGGEAATPLADALLFDPEQGAYAPLTLQSARSRHSAAVDAGGRVLLAGGVGERETVVASAEGLLPEEGRSIPVSVALARAGAAALALPGGELLAVAGGSDGSALAPDAPLLRFDGSAFVSAGPPVPLLRPRRDAALALLGAPATHQLLLGGFDGAETTPGSESALATSELLPLAPGGQARPGPNIVPRARACAVSLPDGRVLVVGGLGAQRDAPTQSSPVAELVVPSEQGLPVVLGMPRLEAARSAHSCTLLPDGTVLIAGGLRDERTAEEGAVLEVRADLLVFTPAPLD